MSAPAAVPALLSVEGLRGGFAAVRGGDVHEVLHGIDFTVARGEITAVVGETGSGKSLMAMTVLRLTPPNYRVTAGRISYDGVELLSLSRDQLADIRGRRIGMVFQDAKAALNPVICVGEQIADVCRRHQKVSRDDARALALDALRQVRIPDAGERYRQYPHQYSGGMAQRALIAMALVSRPELLIMDEPTTGLDVTIQADIMDLIKDLCEASGLTMVLITHDLGIVAEYSSRVVVMRDGRVLETGRTKQLFEAPQHPYTRTLIDSARTGGDS